MGSLPEVLGPAGVWSASTAPEDLADALRRALSDRPRWSGAALARAAAAPGWAAGAAAHVEAYRRAAA